MQPWSSAARCAQRKRSPIPNRAQIGRAQKSHRLLWAFQECSPGGRTSRVELRANRGRQLRQQRVAVYYAAGVVNSAGVGQRRTRCQRRFTTRGTSLTPRVTFIAAGAAAARRPPFTAERCLRTALISAIDAPQVTSTRLSCCISPSVIAGSSGSSTSDEPPPDNRKKTSVSASQRCSSSRISRAARKLSSSGSG